MKNADIVCLYLKRHYRRTGNILTYRQIRKCFKDQPSKDIVHGVLQFDEWLDQERGVAK